ncbi:MAG: hypothetical protein AAF616_15195 [Bacteroidota bacterium]
MKRVSILLFALLAVFFATAQEESSPIKVEGGQKTLELQFVPFGSSPININGVRMRFFSSATQAFRLNAFMGLNVDSEITQQENTDLAVELLRDRSTVFTVSIRPGFEQHINATERLSPYFGVEFDATLQTSSFREEQQNGTDVNFVRTVNPNRSGFIRGGVNALFGLDYYIAKKFYLGTEFGVGFSYTGFLSRKVKSDLSGFEEPDPERQGGSFDLGPNVMTEIRLGYAF